MKNLLLLVPVVFLSGCVSPYSSQSISFYMMSRRITEVEERTKDLEQLQQDKERNEVELVDKVDKVETTQNIRETTIVRLEEKVFDIDKILRGYGPLNVLKNEEVKTREYIIQLKNGAKKIIVFKRIDGSWVGPKNEYYDTFPTDKEVKLLYFE